MYDLLVGLQGRRVSQLSFKQVVGLLQELPNGEVLFFSFFLLAICRIGLALASRLDVM